MSVSTMLSSNFLQWQVEQHLAFMSVDGCAAEFCCRLS